jgi:uncharacterized membrane protein/VanZ family protein
MTKFFLRNTSIRFKIFLMLSIIYAIFIFYLSSKSSLGDSRYIFDFLEIEFIRNKLHFLSNSDLNFLLFPFYIFYKQPDKLSHLILYAGFGFLLYYTLKSSLNSILYKHALLFAIIIGTVYGASDELHQSFVPGRTASIWDLAADCTGVLMAQAVIFIKDKLCIKYWDFSKLNLKNQLIKNPDLIFVPILVILAIIFILIPPFNQGLLRIVFALPLLLFLPGYMLIAAMFPKRGEISPIERFTLSIGLSIAITVFDGFGLNYTRWGFRPNSITISLSIIIGILILLTFIRRYGEESYSFSYSDIRYFYNTLKNKEPETGPDYDPALEKMLIKTMIIAILIVCAMLVYAKVTTEPEKFTVLYILGANGKAENYLTEVSVGEPSTILVGVENYEHAPVNYSLLVILGGKILKEDNIFLNNEEKWVNNVTFIPQLTSSIALAGANKSKLEFELLKDNISYRSVHLLVNTSLDSVKFAELTQIVNGDMESNEGWEFYGSSPEITGGYNNSTILSSRVYEINFTSKGQGSKGIISQNFTIDGSARAVLSFDIKDNWSNISNYTYKQALLDDKIIWESKVGIKNNSWEHVEVPVFLSLNSIFSLGIFGRYSSDDKVMVLLDNVHLITYNPDGDVKIKPTRKVYEFNFNIMGEPHKLEKNMKIYGFNFPGFDYSIDENKSYEELTLKISEFNKTGVPLIDAGNATYITRVKGSEVRLMGSRFKVLGEDLPTNLSRIIEIPSTGIVKLGETLKIGGEYSISVNLISSRGDSAMIALQKGGSTLESKLVGRGIYEYRKNVGQNQVVVFRTRIESITGDSVSFIDMELYSDEIIELKVNDSYGDFEVANIGSDEIVFKNSYPIELKDKTAILSGSVGFRLSGNKLYPFTSNVKLRGTPQSINYDRWMNISSFNYPGFYFENGVSYEELHIYFTGAGFVKERDATYVSKVHNGKISFLGNSYKLIQPNRPGYISNVTTESQIKLVENETKSFEGYNFGFKKIDNNSIQLMIRKTLTNDQQKLLKQAIDFNKSIFPEINYFMLTESNNGLKKSNILEIGGKFEYWEEFNIDYDYNKIGGRFDSFNNSNFNNSSVNLSLIFYNIPFEIFKGKMYGDFEVYDISNDSIILKNTKPLLFALGKEVPLLGGALKIRTSSSEFLAYPEK